MKEAEAELRGRIAMLEVFLGVLLTHAATLSERPDVFIRGVMANVEDSLERAAQDAPAEEKRAAEFAQAAFANLSDAVLAHLLKIAPAPKRSS